MSKTIGVIIGIFVFALATLGIAAAQNPVVVELFTSEGCSSCPPADEVLLELGRQNAIPDANVILLGEHVDYWNYIGWTDRFSSPQFSHRQGDYARDFHLESVYTPQMVIDGQEQLVGNDLATVREKIIAEAKQAKPAQVSLQWLPDNRLLATVQAAAPLHAAVLLAITEDGLSTAIRSGENGGRTLHHAAVVRQLRQVGNMSDKKFAVTSDVVAQSGWNLDQLKVAVLVQDTASGKILGAAEIPYHKAGLR